MNPTVEERLVCGVCYAQMVGPKLLPCLHTFCKECLQLKWETENTQTCPACSTPAGRAATELQDNVLFARYLSKANLLKRIAKEMGAQCDLCQDYGKERPALSLCFECEKFLCVKCFSIHEKVTKRHRHTSETLEKLSSLSSEDFMTFPRKEMQPICLTHEEQCIRFYCVTCSVNICSRCLLLQHKPPLHCIHMVEQEAALGKKKMKSIKVTVQKHGDKFNEVFSDLKSMREKLDGRKNNIEEFIKHRTAKVIEEINEESNRLLSDLEARHKANQKDLLASLSKTAMLLERMRVGQELVGNMLTYGTDQEVMEMHGVIISALSELREAKAAHVPTENLLIGFQECSFKAQHVIGVILKNNEQPEGAGDLMLPHIEKKGGKHPENARGKRKWSVADEQTSIVKRLCGVSEHNYSMRRPSGAIYQIDTYLDLLPGRGAGFSELNDSSNDFDDSNLEDSTCPEEWSFTMNSTDCEDDLEHSRDTLASEDGVIIENYPSTSGTPAAQSSEEADVETNEEADVEPEETLVFFDLETTGLDRSCDIVRLSAVSAEKLFDKYILPISESASVNGMRVVDGILFPRGEPQPTSTIQEAMAAFLKFLQSVSRPVLIGHNIWKFDCSVIHRVWEELSMKNQFNQCIVGFLDTLWLAKHMISRRAVRNYSLHHLVLTYVRKDFVAKNSLEDVKILQELYSVLDPSPEQKLYARFSLSQFECRLSLQPLLDQKLISNPILVHLAKHGVSLEKIKSAFQKDPRCGVQKLFHANGNMGLPTPERTIQKIRAFLRVKSPKDRKLDSMWWKRNTEC